MLAFFGPQTDDELQRGFSHLGRELDLDLTVFRQLSGTSNSMQLTFRLTEKRGIEHLLPLDFRVKKWVKQLLDLLYSTDAIKVSLGGTIFGPVPFNPMLDRVLSTVTYKQGRFGSGGTVALAAELRLCIYETA
jgi:hypothetical protein